MRLRFYIASKLDNAPAVRELRDALVERGWIHTYDWTVHGSVQGQGHERIQSIALAEAEGVRTADFVIVLLPGGRGTHTEFGMALALNKIVFLVGDVERDFSDGYTCAFYHHPWVLRLPLGTAQLLADQITQLLADRITHGGA